MKAHPADDTRELSALLGVARSVASTLELRTLLRLILDHLKVVADYSGASICVLEGDEICVVESRGETGDDREEEIVGVRLPTARGGAFWRTLAAGEPVIIADVRGGDALARDYRALLDVHFESDAIRYIRSFLAVPLLHRDRVIGLLTLSRRDPGYYTAGHARLATAIAAYAAAAIDNARLYEESRAAQAAAARQLERLTGLSAITQRLLAATELDAVLAVVVESAIRLAGAAGAAVGLLEDEGRRIAFAASAGEPQDYLERFGQAAVDDAFLRGTAVGRALSRRAAVAIEDYAAHGDPATRHHFHAAAVGLLLHGVIVAPLLVDGAPIGVLRVHDTRPRAFTPEDVQLIQALADQAALAIEHARLLQRGQEAAVLEERARLARDLHDSVTQSIFSLSMLAQAARTQHSRASDRLGPTLERISTLAQEALIEMRSLLFELQPAALAELGLPSALERLVAAMRIRGDVAITCTAATDARPAPDVELALFRIAQEALANALKHARAAHISVALDDADGHVVLAIADDGVGFDPAAPPAPSADGASGGMGLRSMRDRAAAAVIELTVTSATGAGTTIRAAAPYLVS